MPHPTQKRTKSSKRKRALHFRINKISLSFCSKCKNPVLPYKICSFCGAYAERKVMEVERKKGKQKNKR
jgi:ribosomal protein L32